jgi:hypothetical protein
MGVLDKLFDKIHALFAGKSDASLASQNGKK